MILRYFFSILFVAVLSVASVSVQVSQASVLSNKNDKLIKESLSTADHSRFQELDREFASGPEVTKACLKCHNRAALQFHDTIHWTWAGRQGDKKGEGKAKTLNNF